MAIGDVNGDGKPDLAVANSAANKVSVLMNIGSGSASVSLSGPTGEAWLTQIYPNPTRGAVTIKFTVPRAARVSEGIYDVARRLARTLLKGQVSEGTHTTCWDGKDDEGRDALPGVYLYRLEAAGRSQTRKGLLLR